MNPPSILGDLFPRYTRGERLLDNGLHIAGLILAAIGLPILLLLGTDAKDMAVNVSLGLYALGVVAMLGFSTLYNMTHHPGRKELLRRFDRAAIFLMIAGTYSVFTLAKIGGGWGIGLFVFVWCVAITGIVLSFAFPRRLERTTLVLYLMLGWCIVVVLFPLIEAVTIPVLVLLAAGGVIYCIGVGFHVSRLPYQNAIWHLCVLGAAGCHYAAILDAVAFGA